MMLNKRNVILYIAMSLDGYIAKENDDLSFLDMVIKDGEDYGYTDFIKTTDTVIIGRKTYDIVAKLTNSIPHKDKQVYIITHDPKPNTVNQIFYSGNLKELIVDLKSRAGKNIFIDGGAEIVNELLKETLIDELIISIIPILLGDGIRLFKNGLPEQKLKLINTLSFESGLIQHHYKINNI